MLPTENSSVSPSSISLEATREPCQIKLPPEEASWMPRCVMVPQSPPAAVNDTALVLDVVPVPEVAEAKVAD